MSVFPFVVVEGQDGAGKTTLRKNLFRLFASVFGTPPLSILTTNFLDYRYAGALVRGKYSPSASNAEEYLQALIADKCASLQRLVTPSRQERPVIADRWLLSEMAFFHVQHGWSETRTHDAFAEHVQVAPDITFVLDLPPARSTSRAVARAGDASRDDWDVIDVQTRVHRVYQRVTASAWRYPLLGRVEALDACRDASELLAEAWERLRAAALLPMGQQPHAGGDRP